MPKRFSLLLLLPILAACSGGTQAVRYEFAEVGRGTVERTVLSAGTLQPVSKISVLPLMNGKVEKIFVDYNDTVRAGDILAELNTDTLRLKREQMQAAVQKAEANHRLQELTYRNQVALFGRELISEYELLSARTVLENLAADLAVARSNLRVVETEISQYAFIVSPIDGIVLDRNINIGDTVVDGSGGNAAAIFTLAENLSEMQIQATVSELDVTAIHAGQQVRFSLESLPGRQFAGEVQTLRMIPGVSNNVVSYTVMIRVENEGGTLLPGMTCAVDFIVERGEDVLLVPNAALRYSPTALDAEKIADLVFNAGLEGMDEEQRAAALATRERATANAGNRGSGASGNANPVTTLMMGNAGGGPPPGMGGPMMRGGGGGGIQMRGPGQQGRPGQQANVQIVRNLWYLDDEGNLAVLPVRAGISDGSFTEVRALRDLEGIPVIVRERI